MYIAPALIRATVGENAWVASSIGAATTDMRCCTTAGETVSDCCRCLVNEEEEDDDDDEDVVCCSCGCPDGDPIESLLLLLVEAEVTPAGVLSGSLHMDDSIISKNVSLVRQQKDLLFYR
jgi:hypothetical protein